MKFLKLVVFEIVFGIVVEIRMTCADALDCAFDSCVSCMVAAIKQVCCMSSYIGCQCWHNLLNKQLLCTRWKCSDGVTGRIPSFDEIEA